VDRVVGSEVSRIDDIMRMRGRSSGDPARQLFVFC
jgi:hypothetical protein